MRFDVVTLFPELFAPFLAAGVTRRAYESRQVDVRLALDPAADAVYADRVQVQQVLLNLIRNGIDAMQESGARRKALTVAFGRLAALRAAGVQAEAL